MDRDSIVYQTYVEILRRELVPAMGCTEPIAIAYAAAKARELLGEMPKEIKLYASGNIIKNVKSVVVPNTGGRKGLETAASVGVLYGDAGQKLEVIAHVTEEQIASFDEAAKAFSVQVIPLDTPHVLEIKMELFSEKHSSMVHIADSHTKIVGMERDGAPIALVSCDEEEEKTGEEPDASLLTVEKIVEFADTAELGDVTPILDVQIAYNWAIAEEGMKHAYGAGIGPVLLTQDKSVRTKAKAMAAAGSDARMNGCELPVVINSGSGNQGITTSVPVIVYAKENGKSEEELYRALLVSNLVTLHLKSGIGRLSAYCGAVSAGAGAGAGIAYLMTKRLTDVSHTIVNALAITSGIVCDGAKASCAAKIAMSVDAGILGFEMFQNGKQFYGGDGLVSKGVENTINNISKLGHDGMKDTDKKIIEIMTC